MIRKILKSFLLVSCILILQDLAFINPIQIFFPTIFQLIAVFKKLEQQIAATPLLTLDQPDLAQILLFTFFS